MSSETIFGGSKPEFNSSSPVNLMTIISLVTEKATEEKHVIEDFHRGTINIKNAHVLEQSAFFFNDYQELNDLFLDQNER